MTESPIEADFLHALKTVCGTRCIVLDGATVKEVRIRAHNEETGQCIFIGPQVWVGKYRADFILGAYYRATYPLLLAVECDGKEFHSTAPQMMRDRERDSFFGSQGLKVKRFSGKQIMRDPYKCAKQAVEIVRPYQPIARGFRTLGGITLTDRSKAMAGDGA